MNNDSAQAQEVHATVTSAGYPEEAPTADRTEPDIPGAEDVADRDEVVDAEGPADPDAVIIEEVTPVPAGDDQNRGPAGAHPSTAPSRVDADADAAGGAERMQDRWSAIQSTFVDDPRGSVTAAAELVSEAISTLVASAKERERGLRSEWDRDGTDTEDLRNTLRSYRGFLDRLAAL